MERTTRFDGGETMAWIAARRDEIHAVAQILRGRGELQDELFRTANAQIQV